MKRKYYPYHLWEEVKFGMYKPAENNELVDAAIELLSDPAKLEHYMRMTVKMWPISTERNFTSTSTNEQAWLGQAACCLYKQIPESVTKQAWSLLNDEQRKKANKVADKVYLEWCKNYA